METQNTDGGGGTITPTGTAASMCAISPSDLVGTIGNLISRIESLEKIVSNVLGANLHAQTLGDLSDQVGWVYGVEYMGVPGWIQTEYGTLIPPPGFTMSSSGIQMWNACTGTFQNFQAVVMDENGVLKWGADSIGSLCGTKVQEWDAAAANSAGPRDYGMYRYDISGSANDTRGTSISFNSTTGGGLGSLVTVKANINSAGLYMAFAHSVMSSLSGSTMTSIGLQTSYDNTGTANGIWFQDDYGPNTDTDGKNSTGRLMYFSGPGWVQAYAGGVAAWTVGRCYLHVVKLSD